MINTLHVENFQCHKKVDLEFSPGVNVIAGTSDSGKSALLKSLIWVLANRPQGFGYRRFDCDDAVKAVIETNNHEITRLRTDTKNEYALDGTVYKAMKAEVPSEIESAHGLTEINIQTQFQPHYLLSASASEVVKVFNDACDLSVIDNALKSLGSIYLKAKTEAGIAVNQVKEGEKSIEKLNWVPSAEEKLAALQGECTRIANREQQKTELHKKIIMLEHVLTGIGQVATKTAKFEELDKIAPLILEIMESLKIRAILRDSIGRMQLVEAKMSNIKEVPDLSEVESELQVCDELLEKSTRLRKLCLASTDQEGLVERAQDACKIAENTLAQAWMETKECPLCGQVV